VKGANRWTGAGTYDPAAGGWAARVGPQTHNDQFAGWDPQSAACLGAAAARAAPST
jgi:hypothetical protein